MRRLGPTKNLRPGMGELELIAAIRQRAGQLPGPQLIAGIGDDCAILRPRAGEDLVVTTDFTLEGRHFRRDWHPARSVGHRALARGLSDLAAMGARPLAAFLSLALPSTALSASATGRKSRPSWADEFLDGLLALAAEHEVPLAGGDTAQAETIAVDIVLLGAVPRGKALRRNGARAGDGIWVSGWLGGSAAELALLAEGGLPRGAVAGDREAARDEIVRSVRAERDARLPNSAARPKGTRSATEACAQRHPQLYPQPRVTLGQALVKKGVSRAALDLSDGLSTDLEHLARESGLAAEVEADALPLHPLALEYGARIAEKRARSAADRPRIAREAALRLALHGGEDYELLFTAARGSLGAARIATLPGALRRALPLTRIGRMRALRGQKHPLTLTQNGKSIPLIPRGWQHFRS